eukprot:TRINITY_DN16793_c0_g1_i1.p1 TRINITY_DN16793_c0_g1~~TRINITY_DN16793_c0_g1_i1.p1  ORF type:complete len:301 (+),score=53.91 TRINITY_DN16793_c0_g1_i1:69-905(+)
MQPPRTGGPPSAQEVSVWGVMCPGCCDRDEQVNSVAVASLQLLHVFLCVVNWLVWVRDQGDTLGDGVVKVYLVLALVAVVAFALGASVYYMWAANYTADPRQAQRRRTYGVVVSFLLCDVPLFILEVDILWEVGADAFIQVLSFVVTSASFLYSGARVWVFTATRVIKAADPPPRPVLPAMHYAAAQPATAPAAARAVSTDTGVAADIDMHMGYEGTASSVGCSPQRLYPEWAANPQITQPVSPRLPPGPRPLQLEYIASHSPPPVPLAAVDSPVWDR